MEYEIDASISFKLTAREAKLLADLLQNALPEGASIEVRNLVTDLFTALKTVATI